MSVNSALARCKPSEITIALTGDAVITRPWSDRQDPAFLRMVEVIRSQDAAFTNLEINLLDYETYPMVESGGLHLRAAPSMARELAWAGFRLVSVANNHANDWGVEGMRLTWRHSRAAGLVVAGAGENLAEARAAQYLDTPRGKVALVACASTFTWNARAGASLGEIPARPGVSPLRFNTTHVLTRSGMLGLRSAAAELGQKCPEDGPFTFMDQSYELGDKPGTRTEPHAGDLSDIAAAVSSARRVADLVIVSVHAHEAGAEPHSPAQFTQTFARAMIDTGADAVVGHGPHELRGIEIYQGCPIFYGLGDFVMQNETVERLPLDDYEAVGADPAAGVDGLNDVRYDHDRRSFPAMREVWESVIAVPSWRNRKLCSIKLHPVSLGFGAPRGLRGTPQLARDEEGRRIIGFLERISRPFGTKITCPSRIGAVASSDIAGS